jgi:hypothetical protein
MRDALSLLKEFNPCCPEYLVNRDPIALWKECPNGDWMFWAYTRLFPEDYRPAILVMSECTQYFRNLVTDKRITTALDLAIDYGKHHALYEELVEIKPDVFAAKNESTRENEVYVANLVIDTLCFPLNFQNRYALCGKADMFVRNLLSRPPVITVPRLRRFLADVCRDRLPFEQQLNLELQS